MNQYYLMNTGDMNLYSNVVPMKSIMIDLKDK